MNRFGRWIRLFIVVVFVGVPLQYATAQEPQNSVNEKDWNEWSIKVSQFVAEKSEGILDKKAAELIIGTLATIGKEESIVKPMLVGTDPAVFGEALWDAFKQPVKGVDIASIGGGILIGVVTEAIVDSTRKNWGATGWGEEVKKELTVFGLRQAGVLYATTLGLVKKGPVGALVGANASEFMVIVKTLKESIAVGREIFQTNEQTKITEAQVAVGDKYLKLKADLKAETDNTKKKQLLALIDHFLQGEGSFLFASSNDPNQARKNHIEILAKNAGLPLNTSQPTERQVAFTNEKLETPQLDMRTANSTPAMSSALMQNQLTAITQGGSSHIGSAAYFMGRSPSQDFVRESRSTVAHIPTIRETSQVTNGFIIQAPVDIVLTWGATPSDLDSHLTGPAAADGTRFHTYYEAPGNLNAAPNVMLYRDVTTGTGPEQTRINVVQPGVYRFYVHDFTNQASVNSTALSNSGAVVAVHAAGSFNLPEGNNLGAEVARVSVPTNQVGTAWQAFELDSRTGILNKTTTFRNIADPASVPFNQ